MEAYEVREATPDYKGLVKTERDRPTPADDEVLIRIRAASLNYRDIAIANSELEYPGASFPIIPLSDGAGDVVETGSDVKRISEGDRVATPFAPDWIEGSQTAEKLKANTGANVDGPLAQYAVFPAASVPLLPDYLSYEEGASLSCAGLTAWRALVEDGDLSADETVLVLGTGGVSTFALQFAEMHGARTIVTSSSDEKLERARELGAWETINYEQTPEWHEPVMELTDGDGADHIIEVGGVGTLERSISAVSIDGQVHMIGFLSGSQGKVDPSPILGKVATLEGVADAGSRAMFDRMNRALAATNMTPVIDRIFEFEEAHEAYRYMENGAHHGKIVISVK